MTEKLQNSLTDEDYKTILKAFKLCEENSIKIPVNVKEEVKNLYIDYISSKL